MSRPRAAGTVSVVPGIGSPTDGEGDVRWVSVAVEDGVKIDAAAFKAYVIETLNDNRGVGDRSLGAVRPDRRRRRLPDRVGKPLHRGGLVPRSTPDEAAGSFVEASPTPTPTPTPSAASSAEPHARSRPDSPWSCAQDGVIVISSYDWTAGYPAYGTDYAGARDVHAQSRLGTPAWPRGRRVQGQTRRRHGGSGGDTSGRLRGESVANPDAPARIRQPERESLAFAPHPAANPLGVARARCHPGVVG